MFCEICEGIGLTLAFYVPDLQKILNTAKLHVYILLSIMKDSFPYFPPQAYDALQQLMVEARILEMERF